MKTQSNYPSRKHATADLLIALGVSSLFLAAVIALSSCAYTIHSDGSRTLSIDGEQAMKAVIIYSDK